MTDFTDPRAMWDARYAAAATAEASVWSIAPNAWVAQTVDALVAEAGTGTAAVAASTTSNSGTAQTVRTAVDLGCGEGRNAIWLASNGWTTTGVDFSSTGIDVARARSEQAKVDVAWQVADATTWRAAVPVDLVVIAYLHLSEPELRRAFANAVTSLAPGGYLVVIGHDRTNITDGVGGPQSADILYSPELLAEAASGLTIATCERVLRPVDTADGPKNAIDTTLVAHKPVGSAAGHL